MKKSIVVLTLIMLITLTACTNSKTNQYFSEAISIFTIFESEREVIKDFSLPLELELKNNEKASISWEVIKGDIAAEIVNNNTVKIYYMDLKEDTEVIIKATFKLNNLIDTKEFKFYVPKYGEEEIELKDAYVVYINLDGFAKYYYEEAKSLGLVPNLENLRNDGVFFDNLRTLSPSITNPVQNMIISGATSSVTQNVYRYYDKTNDTVIQQSRENAADTIYHSAVRANLSIASVRHFLAEDILSTTNLNRLYVNTETGSSANLEDRMNQAIKLVKGETFKNGSMNQKVDDVPRMLTIYIDDLDGIGHNETSTYGVAVAKTEEERIQNVVDALKRFDDLIIQLVNAYKERNIYEKTAFFITTDHGMTPFGSETSSGVISNKYNKTRWPELSNKLKEINNEFIFEYVAQNNKPKSSTTIVGVSAGLQMQLTFKNHRLNNEQLDEIVKILENEYYIEKVYTRKELNDLGYWRGANVDLLVIPSERYHFHNRNNSPFATYSVRGQHDSMLDSSNLIYGFIFGGLIKNNITIKDEVRVISFGRMISETLGITLRDTNADILDIYKES